MALSEKRRGRITGSAIGAILGLSPFGDAASVMRSMVRLHHGAASEFTGNIATEYGNFSEEYALAEYEMESGSIVYEHGDNEKFYIHPCHDWLGSTPDGRISDEIGLEIKCPYGKRNDREPVFKTLGEQPHYAAQIQYEMHCSGTKIVHFYQWNKYRTRLEVVEYDPIFIADTLHVLFTFYKKYLDEVENNFEQHLAPLVLTLPKSLVAEEYIVAKKEMEKAKEKMELCKEQLIKLADGQKANIGGLLVYQVNKKGSISYAKAIKELAPDADLTQFTGKASSFWAIK